MRPAVVIIGCGLIGQKRAEKGAAAGLDWPLHDRRLRELEAGLDAAYHESQLPG